MDPIPGDVDLMVKAVDAARIADYLDACPILFAAATLADDAIDPTRVFCVPVGTGTDGTKVWPLSAVYYARVHGVVHPRLAVHVRSVDYEPPRPHPDEVSQWRARAFAPPEARPLG